MSKKLFLPGLAVILFMISAAHAQDMRSEVNIQGTGNFTKNSDNLFIPHRATKSGGFLLGYRYNLNRWLAVQGDYGYTRNTQKYFDPIFGEADIQANVHQLTGEAVITAPSESRVRPYGLAGLGGLFFRPTNSLSNVLFGVNSSNNQNKAAFVYGGGVDFDITQYVAFRAEYRGLVYKIPDFKIPGLASDAFTHTAQPSLGLVWRF